MLLENHYVSCVAVYGILLAGCAWEQIPGLQKRCRLCAHLGTPHVSLQFQATNGAAPVFSCINVSGANWQEHCVSPGSLCSTIDFPSAGAAAPARSAPVPARSIPGTCRAHGVLTHRAGLELSTLTCRWKALHPIRHLSIMQSSKVNKSSSKSRRAALLRSKCKLAVCISVLRKVVPASLWQWGQLGGFSAWRKKMSFYKEEWDVCSLPFWFLFRCFLRAFVFVGKLCGSEGSSSSLWMCRIQERWELL